MRLWRGGRDKVMSLGLNRGQHCSWVMKGRQLQREGGKAQIIRENMFNKEIHKRKIKRKGDFSEL